MQCASTSTYPENLGSGVYSPRSYGAEFVFFCLSVTLRCQAQKAQTVRIRIELGRNGHKSPGQFQFSFQFYNKRRHILLQRQQAIEPFQLLLLSINQSVNQSSNQIYTAPYVASEFETLIIQVPTLIIRDDVISDVIRPGSTIPEDHRDIPYRGTLC